MSEHESEQSEEEDEEQTSKTFLNSKMARIVKLKQFEKGQDFAMYCERFLSYMRLAKLKSPFQHFLQNVDDKTYSILLMK